MTDTLFDWAAKARTDEDEPVLSVAALNRVVRSSLEQGFGDVWVEGELSDVTRAASGHVYCTLNDGKEPAQIRMVMFRNEARRAKAKLENGERVRIRGGLSLYEARGSFQLIARMALPAGAGDLHAQFERLRKKLEAEGLLAPEKRRPLPRVPRVIGVVTSTAGAALHDVIRVARGRCPVRIVVAGCLVQGTESPDSIVAALLLIQKLPELDVVIIGRGGGSAEDLFAFNDERVARAIAACRVPIVSAVGHEVDITIADLVADLRAATPSNAAELVVPDLGGLTRELTHTTRRLERALDARLQQERLRVDRLTRRVSDPRRAVGSVRSRLLALEATLAQRTQRRLVLSRARLAALHARLVEHDARVRLSRDRATLRALEARLGQLGQSLTHEQRSAFSERVAQLSALSPLAVLSRGYAIAIHEMSGRALLRARDAEVGDSISVRVHDGTLIARVTETKGSS